MNQGVLETVGQIIGLFAVVLTFISYQIKEPKKLILVLAGSALAIMINYLLIGALPGAVLNAVCIIRNVVYAFDDKKIFSYKWWPYVFMAAMAALGALSWQGPVSLLIIIPLMINTLFLSFKDNQKLRKSILFTSTLVLIYNLIVFSLGGIINESLAIISSVIGLIRFSKKNSPEREEK